MFQRYNKEEKAILELLSLFYNVTCGMSLSEARKLAKQAVDTAISESKKEGDYYLPHNLGDILLGDAGAHNAAVKKIAEILREKLPSKREEGVRDEDIRWWHNLNVIWRRIILKQDQIARGAMFANELNLGKTRESALANTLKCQPIYGDPDGTDQRPIFLSPGDDRPLPIELHDRIDRYIEKRATTDPEKYREELKQCSTFNALVRKEIRAGNL